MTLVWMILAAVGFFALVMVSIALHEVGHLVPGKLFGVKTTQYFIGFGPTLWSMRRGETEYGLKALPLGGYVRLIGMYPPAKKDASRTARQGPIRRLAEDAREAEWHEIGPEDDGRLFHQKKTWQKLIIMFGGPAMNLLLAFLIFLGINLAWGRYQPTMTVATVAECVVPMARENQTCQTGDPQTPAHQMGIKAGDVIVSFNGQRITNWDAMSVLIRANGARPATVVVRRGGTEVTLPTVNTVITGLPDKKDPGKSVEAGFLGLSPEHELVKTGPVGTVVQMGDLVDRSARVIVTFPQRVWNVAVDLVTGKPRDVNGPISIVGASRVAGELAVADEIPVGDRVASWFGLLGAVNLFVALFNLVPLLPLDGGHMAGALYEAARRFAAKLRGRPDPGHVDTALMLPVAYVVGGFVALAGLVLIIADIVSPVRLF